MLKRIENATQTWLEHPEPCRYMAQTQVAIAQENMGVVVSTVLAEAREIKILSGVNTNTLWVREGRFYGSTFCKYHRISDKRDIKNDRKTTGNRALGGKSSTSAEQTNNKIRLDPVQAFKVYIIHHTSSKPTSSLVEAEHSRNLFGESPPVLLR